MKNSKKPRIAIRTFPSPECVIALAPTVSALKKKYPGSAVGIVADESLREASLLLPDLDFFAVECEETHADHTIDLVGGDTLETAAESTKWKAYVRGAAGAVAGNPYHLVDLLRKTALVDTTDVNFELTVSEQFDP